MKSRLEQAKVNNPDETEEPQLISISIPDDFDNMDLSARVVYVADQLKSSESQYPLERGTLIRHISLNTIERGKMTYAVEYLAVVNSDY